jgi:hypothetical protein
MSIPARHDEDHDLVIAGPILDAIKYLRATPSERADPKGRQR